MFNDDCSWGGSLLGTVFLSVMFYCAGERGRNSAFKEVEEKKRDEEIAELKKQLHEMKKQKI